MKMHKIKDEITIAELQNAMQNNEITSRELVLHYFSRIAFIDKCEDGLNSVVELNPDALFLADALDAMRAKGTILGPLHGIPILLKDNINTHDKMHTCAGSFALRDNYAPHDAFVAQRLRKAGAVILGKTNMTEFAHFMSDQMPAGYSSRGGQTLNPYDDITDVPGSRTGSAVAVSANLCAAAVGTETVWSIIAPSQTNGIVGIRPTLGLLSRHGIIPVSFTFDTPGPIARTVTDAAVLLEVMAGPDENDPATNISQPANYTQYLDKNGLQGTRIGINRMLNGQIDEERQEIFENILPIMQKNGAECIDLPAYSLHSGNKFGAKTINEFFSSIKTNEFKTGINHYLHSLTSEKTPRDLEEIILFNFSHVREALRYGQASFIDAQTYSTGTLTDPQYINMLLWREELSDAMDRMFSENNVDVILTFGELPLPALTGFPGMTIPIGMTNDLLPVGSLFMARRFHEKEMLRVAYAVEQLLHARRNPFR